jgi:hypothetical protein
MMGRGENGWSRREFLRGSTLTGTGVILGLKTNSTNAEPSLETTRILGAADGERRDRPGVLGVLSEVSETPMSATAASRIRRKPQRSTLVRDFRVGAASKATRWRLGGVLVPTRTKVVFGTENGTEIRECSCAVHGFPSPHVVRFQLLNYQQQRHRRYCLQNSSGRSLDKSVFRVEKILAA